MSDIVEILGRYAHPNSHVGEDVRANLRFAIAEIERLRNENHRLRVFAGWCNSPSFDYPELHQRAESALTGGRK